MEIELRPSRLVRAVTASFVAACGAAAWCSLESWVAWPLAAGAAGLTVVSLAWAARRAARAAPAALALAGDGIALRYPGQPLGPALALHTFAQFGSLLLAVTLAGARGGRISLLVAADAVAPEQFRLLAIHARRRGAAA